MRFFSKILFLIILFASFQTAKAEWVKQNINSFSWLKTIHFVDANTGWIGGSLGTFLKTEDGGKTWKQVSKFTDDSVLDIFFSDTKTGWLLCERNIYRLGSNAPSYLMKTTDGGENWEKIEFENERRQRITKIFFAKSGFGLAIGESGVLFGLKDDNLTWKKLSAPSEYLLLDGAFTDNLRGTIVGGGGTILFTEDAGASWKNAYISAGSRAKLNSVFFVNKQTGWTVGSKGTIYLTVNGGKFWRSQSTKTNSNLNDVFFANSSEGWAVGDNGTILHSQTAGNVWQKVGLRTKHKLEKIYFKGNKGWIVGFGGTVLRYQTSKKYKSR